ncbi:MAG: hypothetical protein ACK5JG_12490, partial [Pseudomonadota bacterium]
MFSKAVSKQRGARRTGAARQPPQAAAWAVRCRDNPTACRDVRRSPGCAPLRRPGKENNGRHKLLIHMDFLVSTGLFYGAPGNKPPRSASAGASGFAEAKLRFAGARRFNSKP